MVQKNSTTTFFKVDYTVYALGNAFEELLQQFKTITCKLLIP